MEGSNFEQRCVILGETGIETFKKLEQAYGEHALSRSQLCKWYKAFSEGRESIKHESRYGRPSTSKIHAHRHWYISCMTYTSAEYTVKNSWWWAEELPETCRVSWHKCLYILVVSLCILIVVYVLSIYSYCCLCILIVSLCILIIVYVLSMYSYCCLCILIVSLCILIVVYVLSM